MDDESILLDYFCQHLVGLCWYEGTLDSNANFTGEPTFYGASGFLVQPHPNADKMVLVTAGHLLTEHNSRMKSPRIGYQNVSLFDCWNSKSTCKERIPFDFFNAGSVHDYDKDQGIDFAYIAIPDFISELLCQTTTPFRKCDWNVPPNMTFDYFAMLGLPNEEAEQLKSCAHGTNQVTTFQNPVLIFLDPCERPPVGRLRHDHEFIACIPRHADIKSIVGMSGGPILGFKRLENGQLSYSPIAIQSRWFKSERIVIGSYLAPIATYVEKELESLIAPPLE